MKEEDRLSENFLKEREGGILKRRMHSRTQKEFQIIKCPPFTLLLLIFIFTFMFSGAGRGGNVGGSTGTNWARGAHWLAAL